MKIIIDIRFLLPDSPAYARFTSNLVKILSQANQENEWVVAGRKKEPIFEKDFSVIYLKSGLFKWVEGWILLRFLKQQQSRFYIKIIHYRWEIYKASTGGFTKDTLEQPVLSVDFLKANGAEPINNNAISQSLYPALPDTFETLSWAEMQSVKTQYSGGKDYFIFAGDIAAQHRLIDLLKAFSIFKKWQQSNMLLLIAGGTTTYVSLLEEQLTTYKYRNDVIIIKDPTMEEQGRLVATAYALVHPASANSWPQSLVLAVKHRVAIIASDIPENRIITDDAVWIDNSDLINGFSAAMQLLYKDEQQKKALLCKMDLTKKNNSYSELIAQIDKSLIA
jgi:glycosyltransferase involved in cell wall biosynthesis